MFFESQHSLIENEFYLKIFLNQSFPVHIHRSFEYFMQMSGSTEITVNNRSYTLSSGDAVLIFPYQKHSYKKIAPGEHTLCIFSPDLVRDFYKNTNRIPLDNQFTPTNICYTDIKNRFLQRALIYSICGQFEKNREYIELGSSPDNDVFFAILLYINENFRKSCLLKDAAYKIKYDYAYISKLFKRRAGITFNQYVNLLRIRESQHLLLTTQKNIEEIKFECGYTSSRTFNRKFYEITGTTPSNYRKNI